MKYLLLFLLSFNAFAGEFSVLGGVSLFKEPGNGTYWNNNQEHDMFMTPAAVGLRWDSEQSGSYSFAVQYTHFGEVKTDGIAVRADEPDIGGFIAGNSQCVGGTCAPTDRWRMHSDAQSIALIGTKHFGNWGIEAGLNLYEVKTGGNVVAMHYNYPEARYLDVMPMFGVSYKSGPWSIHLQEWFMPGPGETPPAFTEKGTTTILIGYKFYE